MRPTQPTSISHLRPARSIRGHANQREDQVGGADGDCLQVTRNLAEAGLGEDVVQVIEDRVDARELVKGAGDDSEHDGEEVALLEEWLGGTFEVQRIYDLFQFGLRVGCAGQLEDIESFGVTAFRDQPARTVGDAEEHGKEEDSGQSGDAEFPAPFLLTKVHRADEIVRQIGQQDADDDVDLEGADEASTELGRGQFGDIHGAEDGGTADAEAADKAEDQQERPVPGKSAANRGG